MPSSAGGGVRLSGGPTLLEADISTLESDASSIISISDTLLVSDTEEEMERGADGLVDKQKYRMPDVGKTRLDLRTKEPLSNTATGVQPPQQQQEAPQYYSPETPRYTSSQGNGGQDGTAEGEYVRPTVSRSNSLYTLGRASLQDQLSQLTTMKLPDPGSLANRIMEIPTATEAAKALSDASEQIRLWINKASDVLNGLNAEDDVEWAAAGGREGIDDVDKSIRRFEGLVAVYLSSMDQLQTRTDVSELSPDELSLAVRQMEGIVSSWGDVKKMLGGVKTQVELAMEWERLWNSVLGEVGQEMESLNRLVFEMEETRHQGAGALLTSKDSIDLGDLETIVEERPGQGLMGLGGLDDDGNATGASLQQTTQEFDKNDSSLLALFARMQPLRASLDFLPMKLSVFHIRGNSVFPSACQDLDLRRSLLESQWEKLEADAEFLRRELGEDRWILVFRNAGRQALKMCESITRSYTKLREGVEADEFLTNPSLYGRRVENYTAKKTHYGPAIGRVLAIIDRGVQDRLTVNGEILRLQSDMRERWTNLQSAMKELDSVIDEITVDTREDKQLRDSVSTVLSGQRSIDSSVLDTPGSSPASSVVSRRSSYHGSRTPTPLTNTKTRPASYSKGSGSNRRSFSSSIPRRIPLTHSSPLPTRSPSPSPLAMRTINLKPSHTTGTARLELPGSSRPRWSRSTVVENRDFLPLSAFEPSIHAKPPTEKRTNYLRSSRAISQPHTPSSLSRQSTIGLPSSSTTNQPSPRTPSFRLSHPIPSTQQPSPSTAPPAPSSSSTTTSTTSTARRASHLPVPSSAPPAIRVARTPVRQRSRPSLRTPSGSTATSRRSSVAPPPPGPLDGNEADTEGAGGPRKRATTTGTSAAAAAVGGGAGGGFTVTVKVEREKERPKWRP